MYVSSTSLNCNNYLIYKVTLLSHMVPDTFDSDSGGLFQFSFLLTKHLHLVITTYFNK